MIRISVSVDVDAAIRELRARQRAVPLATAIALTRTAKAAEQALKQTMQQVFDRPTPYTLRSTFIKPATPAKLEARVGIKDQLSGKNRISPAQILAHHFRGGARRAKSLESALARAGLISLGERVVPGAGARLDRYGNMSRGQIQRLLSQLRAGNDPSQYRSESARSKRNVRRGGRIFWSRGGHLARGAWIDQGGEIGIRPLLIVVGGTNYRRLIDLPALVRQVVAREFAPELRRQLLKR